MLMRLVLGLPSDLQAAVFVVLHTPPQGLSLLPAILSRAGRLPAFHPQDGDPIRYGNIYVAPPDHHLLVELGRVRVVRGPRENRSRPAVDPLFRSAARTYGPQVVGVVLTGALDDGTAGLQAIKTCGGITVVQDPADALYSSMPQSALTNVVVDHCLAAAAIPGLLVRLAQEPALNPRDYPVPPLMELETQLAALDKESLDNEKVPGTPSRYACPECHGVLWEVRDGDLLRFRCRVGHAYSVESMLAEHSASLEDALWMALRALEESASLARRLAHEAQQAQRPHSAAQFHDKANERERHAAQIRDLLLKSGANGAMKTAS